MAELSDGVGLDRCGHCGLFVWQSGHDPNARSILQRTGFGKEPVKEEQYWAEKLMTALVSCRSNTTSLERVRLIHCRRG